MVKNTKGGKGAKSMARKSVSVSSQGKTRFSKDPLEIYTIVTKLYGHGRCEVKDCDGNTYMMHIRKKYSGRGRRGNEVLVGVWCLSGLRSYESVGVNVDLLCVYEEREVLELKGVGVVLGGVGEGCVVSGEGWELGVEDVGGEEEDVGGEVGRVEEDEEVNIDEI